MKYMLCRNRVADYAKWKRVFASHAQAHRDSGLTLVHFWRSLDDPNNVFFLFEISSIEKAQAFINAPDAAEAAKASGVIDGEYHFVESAAGY
jgi:hypothetical protein